MHLVHDPTAPPATTIGFEDFLALDIRIGTVRAASPVPGARNPSYRLLIDFGPGVGTRTSAARITGYYAAEALVGRRVLAVVNFAPRQVGPVRSEVLVLGLPDADGAIVLVGPDGAVPGVGVPDGARLA